MCSLCHTVDKLTMGFEFRESWYPFAKIKIAKAKIYYGRSSAKIRESQHSTNLKLSCRLGGLAVAMLSAFLLVCTCTYIVTAQTPGSDPGGGCNLIGPTTSSLITGVGKTGVIPNVQATSGGTDVQ